MPALAILTVAVSHGWLITGAICMALMASVILAGMFGPTPRYKIESPGDLPPNSSPEFLTLLEAMTDAKANHFGEFKVFTNGSSFYEEELEAILTAKRSINIEAYIFQRGDIARRFLDALTERARAGVRVNIVLDFFGSLLTTRSYLAPLLEAGGKVQFYASPAWYRLLDLSHRTHRELIIIDGDTAYIGGAGIADHWYHGIKDHPAWRDTMLRVKGDSVPNLQATFAENWLESCGELMVGEEYFPDIECPANASAMVVNSTPTIGGSTRARVLFQLLIASARESISITTPYFLPDRSLRRELCRAIQKGVKVTILVPGQKSDHMLTRSTSRAAYGELLKAGAEIYEYKPAMIHAKVLCIDGRWSVIGSTNFDNRSFGINDEVNIAICDRNLCTRLLEDNAADLAQSHRVTFREWNKRPITERLTEAMGWLIERQQ